MNEILPSYLRGEWTVGTGTGVAIHDAITGEIVTHVSSEGLDFAGAVDFARRVGGPALRALSFAERAAVVKAAAGALAERKEELYELSARSGALVADAKVDVDGGFGTAIVFASVGRKTLPASPFIVEGPVEQLGRDGTFVGQHLLTPLQGVAVQINAFNFPVWGMLQKLAPALLAGVPTLVKPATGTAHVAEHAVRIMVESGVLPDGALQLVSGSIPSVLDLLGGQDLVGFTGSAATAATLRMHPAVVERSVRFTAEADSLNCTVLGPDVTPGDPEWDLFVAALTTEMITKAGQRCTAIRRAFVPSSRLDDVADAVAEQLSKVVVGAPGHAGVTMGALVNMEQRVDVRAAIEQLKRDAKVVYGDVKRVDVVGGDPDVGAFQSPVLLRCDDIEATAPHEVEAFGPVATLMPYGDTSQLVDLIARGKGSLVGSLATHDTAFARDVVLHAASHHGRFLLLDRENGASSTGHGTPLPQLVHGGPGRAGGGEEEGGLRAVYHHMQRTAIQAGPGMLAAILAGPAD